MRSFSFVLLAVSLLSSACAHGTQASDAEAPVGVKPGKLVWQGHSPQQADAGSLVLLELELHDGTNVLSAPSVITLPHTDAVVRQSFELEKAGMMVAGELDLTVRPAAIDGKRCTVLMKSSLSTTGEKDQTQERARAVRTAAGKWVEVLNDEPIQVRMRCSATQVAHVPVPRISAREE
jgi:hypothetical protein